MFAHLTRVLIDDLKISWRDASYSLENFGVQKTVVWIAQNPVGKSFNDVAALQVYVVALFRW